MTAGRGMRCLTYLMVRTLRNDCVRERLKATLDIVPVALRDRADLFLEINAAWFDEVLKDLCENVGWGFFPENAAAFVTVLIDKLENSSSETTWRWRAEPPSARGVGIFRSLGHLAVAIRSCTASLKNVGWFGAGVV